MRLLIYLPWKGVLVFEHTAEKAVFRHRRDGVERKGGRGRWRIRVDLRLCTPVYMPLVHSLTHISQSIIGRFPYHQTHPYKSGKTT